MHATSQWAKPEDVIDHLADDAPFLVQTMATVTTMSGSYLQPQFDVRSGAEIKSVLVRGRVVRVAMITPATF